MNSELTLFYRPTCPYCQKVMAYIEEAGVDVLLKDVTNDEIRQELIKKGGKQQVPCLLHKGVYLYESDAIIEYLKSL